MAEHPEEAGAAPLAPVPQPRNLPRPHLEGPPAAPTVASADALVQLAAVVRTLSGGAVREAAPPAPAATGRAAQKVHRFQRTGGALKRSTDVSAPGESALTQAQDVEPEQEAEAPARGRSAATGTRRPNTRLAALRKHPFFVWGAVQIFCFGLFLLGVVLGEMESGPAQPKTAAASPAATHLAAAASAAAAPAAGSGVSEPAWHTIDTALAKENAGDLAAAGTLLESLANSPQALPGTEYQLALLALRRGDGRNADEHLERSIEHREALAPCYYVRAARAGASGDYRAASGQLRLAAEAEPFNGRYFFYWGESLRRAGKPPEASAALRQALARPCTAPERELYSFKLRLSQIEAGRNDPIATELEERLRDPSPAGDWLLLAAAENLQRSTLSAAAEFLGRAARSLPPAIYRAWVSDSAFQDHAREPEVARFLQLPPLNPPNATVAPIDPTVCSPADCDPALWRNAPVR